MLSFILWLHSCISKIIGKIYPETVTNNPAWEYISLCVAWLKLANSQHCVPGIQAWM